MRASPLVCALSPLLVCPAFAQGGEDAGPLDGLEYRSIGPAAGGRVSRVAGVAGDRLTYYAATAAGGVWKSVNGGHDWESVFDDEPVSSIGSVAVAPSDANVVWVGSGEANVRGNVGEGNGIYLSTDAGESWSHVWEAEGQIGALAVHPADPGTCFAAVLGSPFGPTEERGVYRTRDSGATWERVLFVDADTGASDVCMDPANPRILFAGTWAVRRTPWSMTSGGEGGGLWTSRDGGDTWRRIEGEGLPGGIVGRVGVRVAPSDPERVYALVEAEDGGLFRSGDGGESWERVNASRGLRQRAWYYTTLTVDPTRADVVWFPQVTMLRTIDGGETVRSVKGGGWDYHDVWIDPEDPRRTIVASDAGVSVTVDGGDTWTRPPLPISQFYHVSVDTRRPYRVLGSLQDWGTVSGPSNSLHGEGILPSDWHPVGGGEAGHVVADPSDPDVVWAGEFLGILTRWDGRLRRASNAGAYPYDGSGHAAADLRHRFQWTAPIVVSRHDPETVYHAAEVVFRTRDRGQSWEAVSPDLSRDDETKQQWSGGPITGDNTGVEFYGTVFALAESPRSADVLWAGTDDGLVHVTRDGGGEWADVTPPDAPEWGTVACVEPSATDAGTAWVVHDAHRLDDETPYLWTTSDFGRSWRSLASGLDGETYLHVVRADPGAPGVLYLGTERGVMLSRDGGASWESLRLNMPTVSVVDLVVAGDDLVVATLGRSAWILDDLTAVRRRPEIPAEAASHLFAPLPTVAWRYGSPPDGSRAGQGANPPEGAIVTYWLAEESEGEIALVVRDGRGAVVRRLSSELEAPYVDADHPDHDPTSEPEPDLGKTAGIHRAAWDLHHEGPERVPGALVDWGDPGRGPRVLPGTYTLELHAAGETLVQPLEVVADPRVETSAGDRAAQLAFALAVRDGFTRVTALVRELRSVRDQLHARSARLTGDPVADELIALGGALAADLDAVEAELHNPGAEVGYDILAGREGGARLHSQLEWLHLLAIEHEGPPTQGMRELWRELETELARLEARLEELFGARLDEVNARAAELGVPYVGR